MMRNAIDFQRFTLNLEKRKQIRKKLQIDEKLAVGHVGRFTFAKNHDFLLDIFIEVHKMVPEAVLVLIGDGELRAPILEKIRQTGIEDNVRLVGKTSRPEDYYQGIDVMIIPSIFEGLPMTAIESQVCGLPTLISEAIPDEAIISNGVIRCSLKEDASQWAASCIDAVGKKVVLLNKSNNYLIDKQVGSLCDWYISKSKRNGSI